MEFPDSTDLINRYLDDYEELIHLTRDKLCKCITNCTNQGEKSWCYVNKDCPKNRSGIRGYYKKCNPNLTYTQVDANNKIEEQKQINITNQLRKKELKRQQLRELREERQRQKLKKKSLEIAFTDLLVNYNKVGNFSDIKLLNSTNYAKVFYAKYHLDRNILDVVIKYRYDIPKYENELKFQKLAAQLNVAPRIYKNGIYQIKGDYQYANLFHSRYSLIIMEYLKPDEWITLNQLEEREEYNYQKYLKNICLAINTLHQNNIAHRDLHSYNIMVNIKHQYIPNNVLIIDYDDATTIRKGLNPWIAERSGAGAKDGGFKEICNDKRKYLIKYY